MKIVSPLFFLAFIIHSTSAHTQRSGDEKRFVPGLVDEIQSARLSEKEF